MQIEANAEELGHIINQISLSPNDARILSEFLKRDDASIGAYNLKLKKFIAHLETIPNSEEFVKALKPIRDLEDCNVWQRYYPIEKTPKTHLIHAEYIRLPHKFMAIFGDQYNGREAPLIFYRSINLLGHVDDKIGGIEKIYYLVKPFGYDFPDLIEADGMTFKLRELYNPHYVCLSNPKSKYKGLPMPIIIDGKPVQPMSNAAYTVNYKKYVRKSSR